MHIILHPPLDFWGEMMELPGKMTFAFNKRVIIHKLPYRNGGGSRAIARAFRESMPPVEH